MTDDVKAEVTTETSSDDSLDYKELWEKERKEKEAVFAKNQELLLEKKKIAQKIEDTEAEKVRLKEEKLLKDGKYDELYKSAQERERIYKEKTQALENERAMERSRNEAMKLASELADGYNAEILTEFLVKRIKYVEGEGVRILDPLGGQTVSSLGDLKSEFQSSEKFKSLLRGSKASGGNATGSGSSGEGMVTREVFDSWESPKQKMNYMKTVGKFKPQ